MDTLRAQREDSEARLHEAQHEIAQMQGQLQRLDSEKAHCVAQHDHQMQSMQEHVDLMRKHASQAAVCTCFVITLLDCLALATLACTVCGSTVWVSCLALGMRGPHED